MNRRAFLKTAGIGAAGLAGLVGAPLPQSVLHALASNQLPPLLNRPTRSVDPIAAALGRIAFGARPGDVEKIRGIGLDAYLETQLYPQKIFNTSAIGRLANYLSLDMTGPQLYQSGKKPEAVADELVGATILRAIYSEAQLQEVMVNFWSDHFSIYHRKGACLILKTIDDREAIRPHAFGKFRDLLGASAKSPAMLLYLDNFKSHQINPNENYAREVMELHTITPANYTELDVRAVARAMTGWTFADRQSAANFAEFAYAPSAHDSKQKTILGVDFPAGGGMDEGERVLDLLASHPGTAKHIATKLCRRFVSDKPPASIVAAVTETYIQTNGDIREMLRTIFRSNEFTAAPPKFKRPFEYFISLCRAIGLQTTSPVRDDVFMVLKNMNHFPFDWHAPNGYSDVGDYWIGNILERWTSAYNTVNGNLAGTTVDLVSVAVSQGAKPEPRAVLDYYIQAMLGAEISSADIDIIYGFFSQNGNPDLGTNDGQQALRDAVALIAASPNFQYR